MPAGPSVEAIEINETLKQIGVTRFYKEANVLYLLIGEEKNGKLIAFDIEKSFMKTLDNLKKSAKDNGVDSSTSEKLKLELPLNYGKYFKLPEEIKAEEKPQDNRDKEAVSSAVLAIHLAKEYSEEFFIDNLGQPYAAIKVDEHVEVHPIKGERFKNWLTKLYFDVTVAEAQKRQKSDAAEDKDRQRFSPLGDILSSESLLKILRVLKAEAEFSGKPRKELYLRVAKLQDTIYYDLTNSKWQAVKITPEGWSIINSPVLFKRYSNQTEQVMPLRPTRIAAGGPGAAGDIFDDFLELLNISGNKDNKLLFKCYIVSLLYHGIVHAALMLHGEGGSAKTSLQEFIKMLVDPSAVLTLSISYDIESMAQKIAHNYVCYLDNISKIPDIISDLLCRAITGTGFMKRELFTVDEEVIYQLKYCIGLTGVNLAATKPDLIDRGLIIEHKNIPNKKRMVTITNKFDKLRPKLLGYIFDILTKVLKFEKEHPEGLQLQNYPRLADFAEIGEIISRCMNNKDNAFLEAFQRNIDSRHRRIVNDSPVGQALEVFMGQKEQINGWTGTMGDLLPLLRDIAKKDLQLESVKNGKYWPQVPTSLSKRINEIKPSLRAIGIEIERVSGDNTDRSYTISKNAKTPHHPVDLTKTPSAAPAAPAATVAASTATNKEQFNSDKQGSTGAAGATFGNSTGQGGNFEKTLTETFGEYLAFDFEFDPTDNNRIDAVSFVDSTGNCEVKFRVRDFGGNEAALLDYINTKLLSYRWTMGWNTQGNTSDESNPKITDLAILNQRCKVNGVPSIVQLRYKGVPYIRHSELGHIDLLNVYCKIMVKDGIYHSYRTNKLDDVSKALLGYGKYKDYSGEVFNSLPIDEAEKYSLMDSQLVMNLSRYKNFEALDAMFAVSSIIRMGFEQVCRTNLTTWWSAVFDKTVPEHMRPDKERFSGTYRGADVLQPKKGIYYDIVVIDGKSLYPSVAINYNLSFDTTSSCARCKDDPHTTVSNMFPYEFVKDFKFVVPDKDWICNPKHKQGFFPRHLEEFKAERLRQKDLGNKAKQHALKILINGGYGAFGSKDFDYYEPRVAELITAAGRYILSQMQDVAKKEYGFDIIYGDTDSLFLHKTTDAALKEFQQRFNAKYDIELEIKNKYDKLLLSAGKKHYIGYEKGEIDIVGYEGDKSDRCLLQQQVFSQLLDDIIKNEVDPLPNLRKVFKDLDANKVNSDLLKLEQRVNKPLNEYDDGSRIYKIAMEYGVKQGELAWFFNADADKVHKSYTRNPTEIDTVHYKGLLFNVVAEILDIAGHDLCKLAQEFGVKLNKDKRYKKPAKKPAKKSNEKLKLKPRIKAQHFPSNSIESLQKNGTGGES